MFELSLQAFHDFPVAGVELVPLMLMMMRGGV